MVANKSETIEHEVDTLFLPVCDTGIFKYASRNICDTMAEKDTMITIQAMLPRFTKSSIRVCSLQLPITELSHFRYLVAVDRSNRNETLSLRLEAMVIVIKERK